MKNYSEVRKKITMSSSYSLAIGAVLKNDKFEGIIAVHPFVNEGDE